MDKTLCIIPARGGSKRVPRKNVLPLNGIPLIQYSFEAAKRAEVFTDILVSTDDPEIKSIAEREGIGIEHRSEQMSADKVTVVQLIKEYIERSGAENRYDSIAALLPTCPFRTHKDVRDAVTYYRANKHRNKFLVGVTEYEFPPQFALTIDDGIATQEHPSAFAVTRSQDVKKYYHANGSIYLADIKAFLEAGTFFVRQVLTYVMPAERSFDIDYPYQYQIADYYAKLIAEHES